MKADRVKLCIIHPNLRCGGSERFISILCNHIDTNVFDVELYVLDGKDQFYQVSNPNIRITLFNIPNVRRSLMTILKLIKKSDPDILFTASNHLNLFLAIYKFLLPRKLKWITRESSIVSINNRTSRYGRFYEILTKKFYRKIPFIICQSAFMQNDLVNNYGIRKDHTIVIANPVEVTESANQYLKRSAGPCKFFTVGRLSPEKGVDRILEVLALLKFDYRFYIIGDGAERSALKQLSKKLGIGDKVIFLGQKKMPFENMEDADLFLSGSHYEGFPNAVLEANMLGIPVAGFNCPGGTGEIIKNGMNGFLAENDDLDALADIIAKAIEHPFNRQLIIEHTKEHYSASGIIRKVEEVFLRFI